MSLPVRLISGMLHWTYLGCIGSFTRSYKWYFEKNVIKSNLLLFV